MYGYTKFEERIAKTIAMIHGSMAYRKWAKQKAHEREMDMRRRLLPKGWHRCGRNKKKRPCWTPRDPASGMFVKGPSMSKTPLTDAVLEKHRAAYRKPEPLAKPPKVRTPPISRLCVCADIVQHFLSCKALLFRNKENRFEAKGSA